MRSNIRITPRKRGYKVKTYKKRYTNVSPKQMTLYKSIVPESKNSDASILVPCPTWVQGAGPAGWSTIFPINTALGGGTGPTTRIGRQVQFTSLLLRVTAILNAGATPNNNNPPHARLLVIFDKQPNGVLPAVTDILSFTASEDAPNAMMNLNNASRFIVISDKFTEMPPYAQGTDTSPLVVIQKPIHKKFNLLSTYTGTTGFIADITEGAFYLMACGNEVTGGATPEYILSCQTRLRFYDC